MKLRFSIGLLGAICTLLLLSFDFLPTEIEEHASLASALHVEHQKPASMPIASGSNLHEVMQQAGLDMHMLPPIAWSCEREVAGSINIRHKLSNTGLVIVEWSSASGTNTGFDVYNASTSEESYQPTLSGTGPFTINVRACSDDVEEIIVQYESLTHIYVDQLTGLKKAYLRGNLLRGIVDFRQATNLDLCHIYDNNIGGNGAWNLKLYLSQVRDLQAYWSAIIDTLDLSTCSNLEKGVVYANQLTHFIPPTHVTSPNLNRLEVQANSITNPLDLSGFPNLTYLRIDNNQIPKVHVDNLPKLDHFYAMSNQLRDTVDLSQSPLLDICNLYSNNSGGYPSTFSLKLYLSQVRILQAHTASLVDTLDLSSCSNLEQAIVHANQLSHFIPPTHSTAPNLNRLEVQSNIIANPLDLRGFQLLTYLRINHNQIPKIQVENLPKLDYFLAMSNQLRDTVDLSQSPLLDIFYLHTNNSGSYPSTNSLKLYLSQVRILQAHAASLVDTLDLSTCTNLEQAIVHTNQIAHFVPPTSAAAPALNRLEIQANLIANGLDLSGFQNLNYMRIDYNKIPKASVHNLPQLTYFRATNNQIRDTIDLRLSGLLDYFHMQDNAPSTANPGNWTLKLYLSQVRDFRASNCAIIDTIDMSTCSNLQSAIIGYNQTTHLTLPSAAPNFQKMNSEVCQLTSVDLPAYSSNKIPLNDIRVDFNSLSAQELDTFVTNLNSHIQASPVTAGIQLRVVNNLIPPATYLPTTQTILTNLSNAGWYILQ